MTRTGPSWKLHSHGYHVMQVDKSHRLIAWPDGTWALWDGDSNTARGDAAPRNSGAGKKAAEACATKFGWIPTKGATTDDLPRR